MRILLVILTFCTLTATAQSVDDKVKEPIIRFFDGMRQSDSMLIKNSIMPGAILQTIAKTKEGETVVRTENLARFITSVTAPHDQVYDERIKFDMIKIDADLAIVWTPYQFYVGATFSHCGVNAFGLVRVNNEWKIQYIIDTRRKDNCL